MSPRPIELPIGGLTEGVVRVRAIADTDLPAIAAACRDPEIARFTTVPDPYEERHAREWMSSSAAGMSGGTDLGLLVVDAESGELLGSVGLSNIDPASGRCSAGYWVAAGARGRGVAARALGLLCDHAFAELAIGRVELWIEPANRASLAVAERAGFTREGLLRSYAEVGGDRRDMLMYSLLPGDRP